MASKLKDAVVVVTGASSGIGRATALLFAEKGAGVVLAARRESVLRDVAVECEQRGGRALVVPTDVTDEAAVQALARRAIEHFGRIDVWVNNAAVALFARFEDAPAADYRRVIETNLFGYVSGARAALPLFYRQGSGVLINVASIMAKVPAPYASAYVVSKHGVRALGECLRQEVALAGADGVHVCTVMPATIDTPLFQHAANYTGRAVKAMPPVYPAADVAEKIIDLAVHPEREIVVGNAGRLMELQQTLAQGMTERTLAKMVDEQHLADEPARPTSGNLFTPLGVGTDVSGGWRPQGNGSRGRRLAATVLVGLPAVLAWRRYRQDAPSR